MSAALSSTTIDLFPAAPFDFTKSLAFVGEFTPVTGEQHITAQTLTKAVRVSGHTIVFHVESTGSLEAPRLKVTLWCAQPFTPELLAAVTDRIRFFLSLDDDLQPFYALARQDALFAPVLAWQYGYHQVKFLTPFENACWSILTQRTPIPAARPVKQRLVERYGGKLVVDGVTYAAFPQAEDFGAAAPAELLEIVGNERKATYLFSLITAFQQVDEAFLRGGSYAEVDAWLRSIKGIGEWSAIFVLLRGLGRMDKGLIGDPNSHFSQAMLNAAAPVYGSITFEQLQALAGHYGEHQGYWAHYLRANSD